METLGSRIMHLVIANQMANEDFITDKKSFLLGGIAPDAVSPKELSHFFVGEGSDYSRSIEYNSFFEKYRASNQKDYILGYYTHLIADDLWLKGFYLPWLKNRMENDPFVFSLYHNDFRLLNGKLLDYYGISAEELEGLEKCEALVDLQEVTIKNVKEFIPYVMYDMNYEESDLEESLKIFTFEQIIGYIETSVEKATLYIKSLEML